MPTRFFSSVISTSVFIFAGSAFGQDHPSSVLRGSKRFQQTVVTSGLGGPWELTWGPDGMLWVTERTGKRITRVDPQTGSRKVAAELIEVSAPGGQDGLLGMALHPDLLRGKGNDFVYVAYTYQDRAKGPDPNIKDPKDPYRYLYMKVVRLTYDAKSEKLLNPANLLTGLPAGNDHNAGRLKFGPDHKLYLTLGDQGHNQLGNFCLPIESQRLPTQKEVQSKDYSAYVGKTLRINLDGSIPADNPKLDGVVSHVFTYGHRNPQGLDFAPDGTLYSSEHGPKTDDEINILMAGANYGWPHVAGLRDGKAYEYARWAEASTPCSKLQFSDIVIHPSVPRESEWAFQKPFVEPIATLFTVPSNYNFQDPACRGVDFVCWPTVGVSSMEYYESKRYASGGIPGWDKVLLVTTLKRGSIYVAELTPDGKKVKSPISRYFQSENRMRDTAVHPDGRTIYVATDAEGLVERLQGGFTTRMQNPGAILAFRYEREAKPGEPLEPFPSSVSEAGQASESLEANNRASEPLRFSAQQAQAGKTAYNASCAVCHGSTMTNGTFGTPLAGEYFRKKWSGRNVHALFQKAKTMPPAAPASLSDETYVNILAYIFEVNGFKAGKTRLPAQPAALEALAIR